MAPFLRDNGIMKIVKFQDFWIVGNGAIWVKRVLARGNLTFTSSKDDALLCFTHLEAEAVLDEAKKFI